MEKEKNNTPKGDLERLIKTVFERDFNDFSFAQLGEIAEVILSCSECPIIGCDGQGRCRITFENALKKESETAKDAERMALDEAIAHSLDKANAAIGNGAGEHLQLAEWLIELKHRREDDDKEIK